MVDLTTTNLKTGIGTVAALSLATTVFLWKRRRDDASVVKKLHVKYNQPNFPLVMKIMASLPQSIRRKMATKGAAPKAPMDAYDVMGYNNDNDDKYDPYEKKELVHGKIWRVRYYSIMDNKFGKLLKDMLGVDLYDPAILDRVPPSMKKMLEEDMKNMSSVSEFGDSVEEKKKMLERKMLSSQDMFVAKLDGGDGDGGDGGSSSLLLYNPCRMHPKMIDWLKSIGNVEYVVSGSSAHTNLMPQAAKAYPDAKIVCSEAAEAKCVSVGMRPANFVYTNKSGPKGLMKLQEQLKDLGVIAHHVVGDAMTQALGILVHGHLFVVDLLYGNKERFAAVEPEVWEKSTDPQVSGGRLFYYAAIYKDASPTGCIPSYRHMGMDPSSLFARLMLDEPKDDGSSCLDMAESLRELLRMDFVAVNDAHSGLEDSLSPDEFRNCIDDSWGWLDGRTLLP